MVPAIKQVHHANCLCDTAGQVAVYDVYVHSLQNRSYPSGKGVSCAEILDFFECFGMSF